MSKDFLLTPSLDIAIVGGDFQITTDVVQKIRQRLSVFRGEWPFDPDVGIPFFEEVVVKGVSEARICDIYKREILDIEEVIELTSFDFQFDSITRKATIKMQLLINTGEQVNIII